MSVIRKLLLCLTLSLFGLAIGLVGLEIGYRIIEGRSKAPEKWSHRPAFYFSSSNSTTMQDFSYPKEKPANVFRVVVVGDSFSFAPFMQFTDAFPKKLEQMLNLNAGERKAEVINFGVPAYSTSHEIQATIDALRYKPDLVILQITLNDPEAKPYRPIGITDFGRFGPMSEEEKNSGIYGWWHSLRFVKERLHNRQTEREYINYFLDLYDNEKTWTPFWRSMRAIAQDCEKNNVPMVAVVFPLFGLPLDDNYPFYTIHEKLDKLLTKLNVPHFDLYPSYKGIPLELLQVIPGVDRHPNEIAHRMAAEEIYLWLERKSLIPEDLRIQNRFRQRTQIINESPWTPPAESVPSTPAQ